MSGGPGVGQGACHKSEEPALDAIDQIEGIITGAWESADSPVVTKEMQEKFDKALEGPTGARTDVPYHPVALLAQQVVAGMNCRILAEADDVLPGYESNYVIVTLYSSVNGSDEITDIALLPAQEK